MAKSKKPRPTFDVARTEISGVRAGWVYRSDAAPVEAPAVIEPVVAAPAPVAIAVVPPPVAAPRPVAAPPPQPERHTQSWFVTGVGAMVFPFSLAVALMAAPAILLLSPRNR